MEFIEAPYFTETITSLVSDEEYRNFQNELLKKPKKGDLIPKTGGARKIRIGSKGKGKQKGSRIIYYFQINCNLIWFLFIYEKKDKSDISQKEIKIIRETISLIKKGTEK